ncbi:Single-stranded DNA binding protein [Methanosarcina sp. KYL-1]|uniref:Single-stranded DNA binding protein n=1 Tax=Methanosarcina sp. KYL-1 TaxID=2602068 RepID=UPI0021009DD9|nr:Single-stranded DNA binding protein [Methanosarcina sp. KYL-1]MCQ1534573.1 Single-stranded DNA binding protein [Methanosarcina sp. KYL-1]
MDEKIAPHLEELTRALGDLEKSGIRAEFEKLLAFRVPPEVAKESILRKFGGKQRVLKVKDLSANLKGFEITGRVLDIGEKAIRPQEGAPQDRPSRLYTGVLADETGSVMFSSWKVLHCSVGDAINVRNAYTRLWQNRVKLSIGEQSTVSKVPDSGLPPISEISKSPTKKLLEVGAADFSVGTIACVLQLSHREVMVRGKQSRVISGVLADETGRLPFTAWTELPGVDIGSIVRIEEAQVRMFRGMPSVNILSGTKVSPVGGEEAKKLAFTFDSVRKDPSPLKIEDIAARDGMFDIAAAGNVVSVRPGSGIISRCPECGRAVQKGSCRVHGKVEGIRDMRIKAVLDDGTGTMSVMFSRELAEIIYGKTLEEAEELMFSDISKDAVYEDLRRILTGRYLAVRGNSSLNEYGISFVAESAWVPEDDLAVRVVELLHRLGSDETDGQVREIAGSEGGEGFA